MANAMSNHTSWHKGIDADAVGHTTVRQTLRLEGKILTFTFTS